MYMQVIQESYMKTFRSYNVRTGKHLFQLYNDLKMFFFVRRHLAPTYGNIVWTKYHVFVATIFSKNFWGKEFSCRTFLPF